MTPERARNYLENHFVYSPGASTLYFHDTWAVVRRQRMSGDCEDYTLAMLWLLSGQSQVRMAWWLLTGRAEIILYRHRITGSRSIGLCYLGGYIDVVSRWWNDGSTLEVERNYERVGSLPWPFMAFRALAASPFLVVRR